MSTLVEFFKLGHLGPIRLGMTARAVSDILGLPDDIDDLSSFNQDMGDLDSFPYGTMVTYGALHLAFIDGELWYYILDVHDGDGDLHASLGLSWVGDLRSMTRATFAAYLTEHDIVAREFDTDEDDGIALRLIIGNAIMVLFDLSDEKDQIHSLHRSVPISQAAALPRWQYAV